MQAVLSGVQGIPKLLRWVTCVVMVTVSRLIQFGLQGRDLEPVGELLLLQRLLILRGRGDMCEEKERVAVCLDFKLR